MTASPTCLRCHRPLTDPESRKVGYGPICRSKVGLADVEQAQLDLGDALLDAIAWTHDYRHHYHGYWTEGGVCRVRVLDRGDDRPVIVITELPENRNTSITNMAEYLWAEILARHCRGFVGIDEPAMCIEHYPPIKQVREATYDRVTFSTWQPRELLIGGLWRRQLGAPEWEHLGASELAALLGIEVAS